MKQERERRMVDQQNWMAVAREVVAGRRVPRTSDEAEAVIIGLRHYQEQKVVQQALDLLSGFQFKNAGKSSQGSELVRRLSVEWKKPLIR